MSHFHCLNNTSKLEAVVAEVPDNARLFRVVLATEVLVEGCWLATEKVRFCFEVV